MSGGAFDPAGRGWFAIEGRQDGDRTLAEQLLGLAPLLAQVADKTILDLGCAEGLISFAALRLGARAAFGVEAVASRVNTARELASGRPAFFEVGDLDEFKRIGGRLHGPARFDVVLALSIAHKLRRPGAFLQWAAGLAVERLAVRTPRAIICDRRSKFKRVDVARVVCAAGFLVEQSGDAGPRGEWVGLFRRRVPR